MELQCMTARQVEFNAVGGPARVVTHLRILAKREDLSKIGDWLLPKVLRVPTGAKKGDKRKGKG